MQSIQQKIFSLPIPLPIVFAAFTLFFFLNSNSLSHAQPIIFTDDTGERLELSTPAKRIVPLYGAFNDILEGMGLQALVVARTATEESPSFVNLPVIGTHMRPSLEMVVGLEPDLVLQIEGRSEAEESAAALRLMGVKVAVFKISSFDDLFRVIDALGVLTGDEAAAQTLSKSLKERISAIEHTLLKRKSTPSVFYELRYPKLIGAGPGSISSAIIAAAGGTNCLKETVGSDKVMRVNEEQLLLLDPDVYLIQKGPMNKNPVPIEERDHLAGLKAVKNGHVFELDEKIFSRPGPQNIKAVEELARLLHPELF